MTAIDRTQLQTALRALGELLEARGHHRTVTHDPSPGFRSLLVDTLSHLGVEVAGGSLG